MDRVELQVGAKDAIPIVLGYLPLGFAFGVLASQAGMTITQATAMSVLCFTGAGQYPWELFRLKALLLLLLWPIFW